MRILVTGGGGYIGSHMVKFLHDHGCQITIIDNLSSGFRDAIFFGNFVEGNFGDKNLLDNVLAEGFDCVVHFASLIQVSESMENPDIYYENNFVNTLTLLNSMRKHGINRFIFSSTAAIFGEPIYTPIDEQHPQLPISPYGRTKLMTEWLLKDYDSAYGMKSICLRYFNAAGADPSGCLGERHEPETHLIPLTLQVASGRRKAVTVFGRDYDTHDGTCVRDYIHVLDLCSAHWLAIQSLMLGGPSSAYNLGNGNGFSVQEVIKTARLVTGKAIPSIDCPRRLGDPAYLISNSNLAREKLKWIPQYTSLESIIQHAWRWETLRITFNKNRPKY